MNILNRLHEIRMVKNPSTKDFGIETKSRTTILQPTTTIGNILEKDLMLNFRLRAIPGVS